jgi:uncharacterized protein with HEPN domain
MPRDFEVYLEDILEAIRKVRAYAAGMDRGQFEADEKTVDAVVRNLEIIGEAVKQIPEDVRQTHPQIPWRKISGLRDLLIHQYFGVNLEIVWDIIQTKLDDLEHAICNLLGKPC